MAAEDGQKPNSSHDDPDYVPSDRTLLRLFKEGDQDAAAQIYVRYASRLYALAKAKYPSDLANCADAEDIVQSVFRRFFQRAGRGHYEVAPGEELWRLFLVIALNRIRAELEFHRAGKRDVRLNVGGIGLEQLADARAPHGPLPDAHLRMVVREALERLPPQHQKVVRFRMEGWEIEEIAQDIQRSKRTVERILKEARQTLRVLLCEERLHES